MTGDVQREDVTATERAGPELREAITLYLPPHIDRWQVARLVKSLCSLNGVLVAIEVHEEATDG